MNITPININKKRIIKPTNSLILLIPNYYYKIPNLINLLKNHFKNSYGGNLLNWTNLIGLSRILLVYDEIISAKNAKIEMDFFVWEEDDEEEEDDDDDVDNNEFNSGSRLDDMNGRSSKSNGSTYKAIKIKEPSEPLRVFYGPLLSLPLPSLEQTLLSVPALSKNFLISPPGSPPVGWEQTLEEAPNSIAFDYDDIATDNEGGGNNDLMEDGSNDFSSGADGSFDSIANGGGGSGRRIINGGKREEWGDELARALRYLSVSSNDEDQLLQQEEEKEDLSIIQISSNDSNNLISTSTTTIIPPTTSLSTNGSNSINSLLRPSITLSTPPISSSPSSSSPHSINSQHSRDGQTNLSNSRVLASTKITNVKATIESMLGRKKSLIFNLGENISQNHHHSIDNGTIGLGQLVGNGNRVIIPTARPPTNDESPYLEF